ncbi:MAG TPA: ParB/RepB/Spo0J family partition protein [Anaerolineaceae bacterium]|jgi:ParB family chromosome partitioning protein|nr:ParB/RepB/Spo0J family partition protein [Anaerolineales bacterium]HOG57989.1 ParB/RepB/Spo0J family partition protein [Anaerolineaceae bacterium]HOR83833.1 ParB/RepB/Spo0J family partition protein [Anaerolineaceae bacterium]HPL42643.1 ParB/RepB/Spo0J family partition protein [Anaerolineaceae bacterium]HPY32748.1 ParB/RepB/Spo0J family partition protein [Anaerolineaceae bacterium]
MARKTGLGKGLDALIPSWQEESLASTASSAAASADSVVRIAIDRITPNPRQPRKIFSPESLQELADSILQHGILQPLILVQTGNEDRYTLIAGERRWRAAALAGLKEVPALVRSATLQEQLEFAIIENIQREDLNALERAHAYQSLLDEFSLTHDEIAQKVGKSRAAVTNTLRLLNLPVSVQQALQDDLITEGHARSLLGLNSARSIEAALETVLNLGLNVRQTEILVGKLQGKAPRQPSERVKPAGLAALENKMRQFFKTKVSLQPGKKGGSITIYYYSDEELNSIADALGLND